MRRVALCVLLGMMLLAGSALAQTEIVLHDFFSGDPHGGILNAGLILDSAGNLYGTASANGDYDAGTVFELTPVGDGTWNETILYTFSGGTDGGYPSSTLVFDSSGNLYGTTTAGGDPSCFTAGCGVVFRLSRQPNGQWSEKILYRFVRNSRDGTNPIAGLVIDSSGNLYGTTPVGGTHDKGIVYRLSPSQIGQWKEEKIHTFNGDDGANPAAALIFDADGNLYGTTQLGGTRGCGNVFQLVPNASGSWTRHVLHSFTQSGGCQPYGGVIFDPVGNLYGTTSMGGSSNGCYGVGCGTIYQLTPQATGKWSETLLYRFSGGGDGALPYGGLVRDSSGNFYGAALTAGSSDFPSGYGTAFRLSPNTDGTWTQTVLHTFSKTSIEGCYPHSALALDSAGNLFGTTLSSDSCGSYFYPQGGAVFEITP